MLLTPFILPTGGIAWLPLIGSTKPNLFADFTTEGTSNHYWYNGAAYGSFAAWLTAISGTFSRASTAYYTNSSGNLAQAGSGVIRFDYDPIALTSKGLLLEGSSTNLALHSRDLTNASWTKTNGTAALDQTGADGNATSASSFTATAGNATALQTITQSSTNDTFSVYLKRITGTGEVDITLDGGSTWTNVTSLLIGNGPNGYVRVSANETVTNSSFGIRLVTNGDKVAVDFTQIEALAFASSPIPTTSATVTRAADSLTATPISSWYNATNGVLYAAGDSAQSSVAFPAQINIHDGPGNNWIALEADTSASGRLAGVESGGVTSFLPRANNTGQNPYQTNVLRRAAMSAAATGFTYVADGGVSDTGGAASMPVSPTKLDLAGDGVVSNPLYGHISQIGYWPTTATGAQLQTLTAPPAFVPTAVGVLPSIFADFAGGNYMVNGYVMPSQAAWMNEIGGTFSRASTAYFTGSNGLLQQASSNQLRFDYDPVALTAKGVLLEGASMNLAVNSQNFAAATYASNGISLTSGIADPAGGTAAYTITATASNGEHDIRNITGQAISSGTTYTHSVYIKPGTATFTALSEYSQAHLPMVTVKWSDLSLSTNGQLGATASLSGPTDGFYRLSMTWTATSNATSTIVVGPCLQTAAAFGDNPISYNAAGTESVIAFGEQVEALPFASSYIPTTSSTVTRAADSFSFPWSATTFTAAVKHKLTAEVDGNDILDAGSGLITQAAGPLAKTSNGTQTLTTSVSAFTSTNAIVLGGTPSARVLSANGSAAATDANALVPSAPTTMQLGANTSDANNSAGDYAKVGLWSVAATAGQAATLSGGL